MLFMHVYVGITATQLRHCILIVCREFLGLCTHSPRMQRRYQTWWQGGVEWELHRVFPAETVIISTC